MNNQKFTDKRFIDFDLYSWSLNMVTFFIQTVWHILCLYNSYSLNKQVFTDEPESTASQYAYIY